MSLKLAKSVHMRPSQWCVQALQTLAYPLPLGKKLAANVASEPATNLSLTESSVVTTFLVVHFSFTETPLACSYQPVSWF